MLLYGIWRFRSVDIIWLDNIPNFALNLSNHGARREGVLSVTAEHDIWQFGQVPHCLHLASTQLLNLYTILYRARSPHPSQHGLQLQCAQPPCRCQPPPPPGLRGVLPPQTQAVHHGHSRTVTREVSTSIHLTWFSLPIYHINNKSQNWGTLLFTLIKVAGDQAAAAGVGRVGQVDHREADEDHPW